MPLILIRENILVYVRQIMTDFYDFKIVTSLYGVHTETTPPESCEYVRIIFIEI